ncbi:hypothetical protein [Paenibacillus sp. SI8]|uniref:hypothetical protein n=1 Tax=unclassified Paenibacillus TaxID=185978 RepID=UPI003465163D
MWTIEDKGISEFADINEHIVKVEVTGMIGVAIDKDGKVWIFESAPQWLRNDPTFLLNTEPMLLSGLDYIKDVTFGSIGALFLKDDAVYGR